MFRWISENYRTFLWALALSVAVWVAAVSSADPDETRILPDAVLIEIIGQDPGLVMSSDIPGLVELTLRAPRSVWNQIEADSQSIRAILDLSGLSAGGHTQKLQIQINARPVQIITAVPDTVTFEFETLATQKINVDLSLAGEPAIGYQAGEPILDPEQIIVAGAQSQIEKVTKARLSLNLDGLRDSIDESLPVEILDDQGQPVSGLTLTPESVHINLSVSQQGGYRDLAVKVVVTGQVASGYRLTNISVFPPVITVFAAEPDLVGKLTGVVETQPLDLQDANDNINTRLTLNLPAGITIVGEQTVLIQAGISPIESSLTMSGEKVEVLNTSAGLIVQVSPETVDVIVSGPLPLLDTLTRQDIQVTVDLTGLGAGIYQLTPKVEILIADVIVESILPGTIEVILFVPGTPNLTPVPSPTP